MGRQSMFLGGKTDILRVSLLPKYMCGSQGLFLIGEWGLKFHMEEYIWK